jgi:hypothetical protein
VPCLAVSEVNPHHRQHLASYFAQHLPQPAAVPVPAA